MPVHFKYGPVENMLDIDLTTLTMVKRNRNKQKSLGLASYGQLYSEYDTNKPANKISIMGNPTLGDIRTVMIVCAIILVMFKM